MACRAFLKQQAVNRMKSNFVSSISHELRAPIASIRLMAERLRAGKVDEKEKRREYFDFIEQGSRRLATLVENVLDFSRIEDGRKTYNFKEADIEQLAADTVQLMRPYAAEKKVTLETDLRPPANAPTIDPTEIQKALINLIDNAIKYSPEGKNITISLAFGGSPREEQQKIFQRFYRVGSELERETQGVGSSRSPRASYSPACAPFCAATPSNRTSSEHSAWIATRSISANRPPPAMARH